MSLEPLYIILFALNHLFEDICKFSSPFGSLLNWFQQCTSTVIVTAPFSAKGAIFVFGFRKAWNLYKSFCFHQIITLRLFESFLVHLDHCLTDFSSVLVHLQLRHLLVQKLPYLYLNSVELGTFIHHFVCIKSSLWGYLQVF